MINHDLSAFQIVFKRVSPTADLSRFRHLFVLISIIFLSVGSTFAQISVGLLTKESVSGILIAPNEGKYLLKSEAGDTLYKFRSDDAVSIEALGDNLVLKSVYGLTDTLQSIAVIGTGTNASIYMRIGSEIKQHIYFETVNITAKQGLLNLVNNLNLDRYVSLVVQAEVGSGAADEYYKIQSIICRTYAMRNLERHATDGYDLCDHEHCQVFSGIKPPTNAVIKATAATSGYVMVGSENELILSAFHANCGGQTSNSEDVWRESRSYLTSVIDTFCLEARSSRWSKSLPLDEFLSQAGLPIEQEKYAGKTFNQPNRKKYFVVETDSVETSKMRRYLGLRSTFFDITIKDNEVEMTGRGYGHGVGLCQQGAMKMAESGYTYSQILGYYYKGVSLVPINSLQPEK